MFKKLTNFSRLFIFSVFVIGVFGTKLRRALLPRTPQSIVGFDPRILMSSSFVVFTVLHVLPLRPRAVAPRSCGRLPPPALVLIPRLRPRAVAPRTCGRLPPPAFVLIPRLGPRAVAPRSCGSLPPPTKIYDVLDLCSRVLTRKTNYVIKSSLF